MDKYGGGSRGVHNDRAFWLKAYNGVPEPVNRVGRGVFVIPNLSVSILGGIQSSIIRSFASETIDDGLLARLIMILIGPATKGKDRKKLEVVLDYEELVDKLHLSRKGLKGYHLYKFSDDALEVRERLEARHLELQQIEGINRKLSSHIGKYDGIFARLCLIWHCIENPEKNEISADTAERVARFLHEYLFRHAVCFYMGLLGLSDDHDRLTAVAGYILARKLKVITRRDVQRGDRSMRGLNKYDTDKIFNQLEALGWLICEPGERFDRPQWVVNSEVHRLFAEQAKTQRERRERERKLISEHFATLKRDGDAK
jgi:hypothetical protein